MAQLRAKIELVLQKSAQSKVCADICGAINRAPQAASCTGKKDGIVSSSRLTVGIRQLIGSV
ncbi:hypothetical protein CHELA1G2_11565 [Hyphomicrobiales bacterium]|nr:hypothetical protein CHELA1G2_11565 [Hyphomicrobiales bacterium]